MQSLINYFYRFIVIINIESQAGIGFVGKLLILVVWLCLIGIVVRFLLLIIIVPSHSEQNLHLKGWFVGFEWPSYDLLLIDDLFRLIEFFLELHFENIGIFHLWAFDFDLHNFLDLEIGESLKLLGQFLFGTVEDLQSDHFFIQEVDGRFRAQKLNSHARKVIVAFIEFLLIAENDEDGGEGPASLFREELRFDPRLYQWILIWNDAIFDEKGDNILEQALHLHVGVLLFFVDGANNIVIGYYVWVYRSVFWWLFHLDEIVPIEILFCERGKIIDVTILPCEVG